MKKTIVLLILLTLFKHHVIGQSIIQVNENLRKLDIQTHSLYWIDDDYHQKDIHQIIQQKFQPLKNINTLRKNSDKIIWLKFKIQNTSKQEIPLILNVGRHFFLDMFVLNQGKLVKQIQAGTFVSWENMVNGYSLPISAKKEAEYDVYVRMGSSVFYAANIYSTPTLSHPEEYQNQIQKIYKAKKSHALLFLCTIGFLTCGFIVILSQYLTSKRPLVLYYLSATIISEITILKLAEFNLDLRFIAYYIPAWGLSTFILQLLQHLSFYILVTQIFSIKQNSITKLGIPVYSTLLIIECFMMYQLLEWRTMPNYIYWWYAISLFIADIFSILVIVYAFNKVDSHNRYIVYGFVLAFSLFGITFYKVSYSPPLELIPSNFFSIPSVYICFATILAFVFFMIALSKKIQIIENESLMKGQSDERNRIARELHDNVNSLLASVKLTLQVIRPKPEQIGIYQNLLQMIDNATQEVRHIAHNMIPFELEKKGLQDALLSLIKRFQENSQINFELKTEKLQTRLKLEIEFILYQICLEICQNIINQNRAKQIKIELDLIGFAGTSGIDSRNLYLFIWTDQKNTPKPDITAQILNKNILHKAKSIGAEYYVKQPEEATIYVIRLPFKSSIHPIENASSISKILPKQA